MSARLVRAASRARQQKQRVVAIASEWLNIPTRAEVDDAYREIQELKRELRRLRKSAARPPATPVPAVTVNQDHGSTTALQRPRSRPPAAKRKTPLKGTAS